MLSNKDVIARLDKLTEIVESMQSSRVIAIEEELAKLHDWHTASDAKSSNTSNTMTWFWRIAPWIIGMAVMAGEFKYLTK